MKDRPHPYDRLSAGSSYTFRRHILPEMLLGGKPERAV